ncbi:MAG: BlaI/MecI/CopY family transcriptional regulator, partial [Bacteroidales bacterium]|nr:BlaI/MecI/CopY family transcriptional regulator [Bacteroidales bacterium]
MRRLTKKEEAIMSRFWEHGALFVRELRESYPDPKPHFNTLSTQVRTLEADGFLSHEAFGSTYRYQAAVSQDEYREATLTNVVDKFFGNSYLQAVSALVKDEKISVE